MRPVYPQRYFVQVGLENDATGRAVRNDSVIKVLENNHVPYKKVKAAFSHRTDFTSQFKQPLLDTIMIVGEQFEGLVAELSFHYSAKWYWGVRHDQSVFRVGLADGTLEELGYLNNSRHEPPGDSSIAIIDPTTNVSYFVS